MPPLLYLDTARLGQMTPAAKDAQLDFVRLTAEEPSSLYFEEFLQSGYSAWPDSYQLRFPGLHTWNGVSRLKQSIREIAGAPDDWRVLLASRSLSLVGLAASSMFRACRNVLATDLSWPTYSRAIEARARQTRNHLTTVPIRDEILYHGWTDVDVANFLAEEFSRHRCDGLFLPAVDHLGIRLPIPNIVGRIRERSELRFCFIDAAQAFCHVPLEECFSCADFVVAGSHKWMGAYLPTGIGLFGQPPTRDAIMNRVTRIRQAETTGDPLLHFTEQLTDGGLDGHAETANLTPLFACSGAAGEQLNSRKSPRSSRDVSMNQQLSLIPRPGGQWQPLQPDASLRSRIVLFEPLNPGAKPMCPHAIRRSWLDCGCIVTGYPDGRARISLPR